MLRYEIQRFVLDKNHPDWDVGQRSGSQEGDTASTSATSQTSDTSTTVTTTTATVEIISKTDIRSTTGSNFATVKPGANIAVKNEITTPTDHGKQPRRPGDGAATAAVENNASSSTVKPAPFACLPSINANPQAIHESGAVAGAEAAPVSAVQSAEVKGDAEVKAAAAAAAGAAVEKDVSLIGVWTGQKTEKMVPYFTTCGLPTYCRYRLGCAAWCDEHRAWSMGMTLKTMTKVPPYVTYGVMVLSRHHESATHSEGHWREKKNMYITGSLPGVTTHSTIIFCT